jgi:hypothetical protein
MKGEAEKSKEEKRKGMRERNKRKRGYKLGRK